MAPEAPHSCSPGRQPWETMCPWFRPEGAAEKDAQLWSAAPRTTSVRAMYAISPSESCRRDPDGDGCPGRHPRRTRGRTSSSGITFLGAEYGVSDPIRIRHSGHRPLSPLRGWDDWDNFSRACALGYSYEPSGTPRVLRARFRRRNVQTPDRAQARWIGVWFKQPA
jgi:hypothetical protein